MKSPAGKVTSVFSDSEADEEEEVTNNRLMELKISPVTSRKYVKGDSKLKSTKTKRNGHPPVVHPFEENHTDGHENSCCNLMFGRPTPSPSPRHRTNNTEYEGHVSSQPPLESMHGGAVLWPDYPLVPHSSGFAPRSCAPSCCCSDFNGATSPRPKSPSPAPMLSLSPMGIPQSYNIYYGTGQDGLYRSSSVASVFGGCKGRKPILSPPKLTSVNSHHYQMLKYSSIHCKPYNMMMGYGYSSASLYQGVEGVGLRNMYNSSPSTSQSSSGFVSGATTTSSVEGWPVINSGKSQVRSGHSQGYHNHCCCSRRSMTSSQCHSVDSDNHSGKLNSDGEIFSDDEDMDYESKSSMDSSLSDKRMDRPVKKESSRIIKKGTIKTDSVTLESSSTASALLNAFLRIFIFLNVLFFFCIFFVGKWPEPLDRYIDTIHDAYQYLWNSSVPYIMSCLHVLDATSTVFPY